MAEQRAEFSRSLKLAQQQNKVPEDSNLKLPNNVSKWRVLHVQAWLAHIMELSQYCEPFKRASIDGIVLIKHVDENVLEDLLGVNNDLHLKKLMIGIHALQDQYKDIEKEANNRRRAELSLREAREEEGERLKVRYLYAHIYVYICVHIHICIDIHIYLLICVCIYMYFYLRIGKGT
jgi:hypothetical protein